MWDTDDQGVRAYAAELGDEWTEVEPGIFVRVEGVAKLQVVAEAPEPQQATKEVS
jgi:tRNA pseudouridine-54 N-methylase